MAVRKSINIAGSGPTFEEAVQEALDRAYTTLEGITGFEVTTISGELTDAGTVSTCSSSSGSRFWSGCTSEPPPVSTTARLPAQIWPDGIGAAAMPIGVNHIDTVNVYLVEDGDSVTLVDCGMWRPGEPDDGLTTLRHALHAHGYALDDISRIIVTHAHVDHYGMAGRLMELTGAELLMHAMTDLDCEKYRHPDTAQARKRDTYSDHGVPNDQLPASPTPWWYGCLICTRW